jgi:hypothetical protein
VVLVTGADGASGAITYAKDAGAASAVVKAIEPDGGKAVATFGRFDVLVNQETTFVAMHARTQSRLGKGRTWSLLSLWQDPRASVSGARVKRRSVSTGSDRAASLLVARQKADSIDTTLGRSERISTFNSVDGFRINLAG